MCRILTGKFRRFVEINGLLEEFAMQCRNSEEYQGHGWGITYFNGQDWITRKWIEPIWQSLPEEKILTSVFLVHARSAFRDEGIKIENNMPFENERYVFAFNGELRDVRLKAKGETGAHKIFNMYQRHREPSPMLRLAKLTNLLKKRSGYIKAMNIAILDKFTQLQYVYSYFNENPDYFRLHRQTGAGSTIISSVPLVRNWVKELMKDTQITLKSVMGNQFLEVI